MNPSPYFFRVEHDLLRSEAFKTLGGSAIKVYLVIGLYSDFGTDWAYPSIRTIARQAGLSRQTVLNGIEQLSELGLLVTNKAKGRSTAYRIIRQAPQRPSRRTAQTASPTQNVFKSGLNFLDGSPSGGQISLDEDPPSVLEPGPVVFQVPDSAGPRARPKGELTSIEGTASIPIPGTPFRLTAEGRLQVAVDLQELLTNQGISAQLAQRLLEQKDPEAVAKVLLNALYLQSQGKLQNGAGYIRAGIEDGYDLLPQVANGLEIRRRELTAKLQTLEAQQRQLQEGREHAAEQAAISYVLTQLPPVEIDRLVEEALRLLPEPIVARNPTLSNPFVRAKVYELACGNPEPEISS
jgi:biotin operon repressor